MGGGWNGKLGGVCGGRKNWTWHDRPPGEVGPAQLATHGDRALDLGHPTAHTQIEAGPRPQQSLTCGYHAIHRVLSRVGLSPKLAYPLPTTDQEVHQIRKLVCEILAEDGKLLLQTARPTTGHASAPQRMAARDRSHRALHPHTPPTTRGHPPRTSHPPRTRSRIPPATTSTPKGPPGPTPPWTVTRPIPPAAAATTPLRGGSMDDGGSPPSPPSTMRHHARPPRTCPRLLTSPTRAMRPGPANGGAPAPPPHGTLAPGAHTPHTATAPQPPTRAAPAP